MEGAEAGRREKARFKKINDESYYMIIVLYT